MKNNLHGSTSPTTPETSSGKSFDSKTNSKRIDRIGEMVKNRQGLWMEIVAYHNRHDMEVRIVETGEIIQHVRYDRFKAGKVDADLEAYCAPLRHRVYKGAALFLAIIALVALIVGKCCGQ